MKSKVILIFVLLFNTADRILAQSLSIQNYIVFTFEDRYKLSEHGPQTYFWIIPQDSIKSYDNILSHLFLSNFSKDNLVDCFNGVDIDPFLVTKKTNYQFDSAYYKDLANLREFIIKNQKKLQKITKVWETGQKEEITVSATPISGKFCSSNFHKMGQVRYGYKGKVYIPYSSFSYNNSFWDNPSAKYIFHQDFSRVRFDIIPY